MGEFNGNFEGEMKTPEQQPIPEMSQEAEKKIGFLFKDDHENEEVSPEVPKETPINIDDVMNELFGDDYSETIDSEDSSENKEQAEQETIDLTKQYEPNSKFEVNGQIYETDDNGSIYKINVYELIPDCEYTIGGVTYKTDDQGRIVSCDGNATSTPEGERDNKAQIMAGGAERREGDQGGHILARILGGAKGIENMLTIRL